MTVTGAQTPTGEADEPTEESMLDAEPEAVTVPAETDAGEVDCTLEAPVAAELAEDVLVDDAGESDHPGPVPEFGIEVEPGDPGEIDGPGGPNGASAADVNPPGDGDGDAGGEADDVFDRFESEDVFERLEAVGDVDRLEVNGDVDRAEAVGDVDRLEVDGDVDRAEANGDVDGDGAADDAIAADGPAPNGTVGPGDTLEGDVSPPESWLDPLDENANESIPVEAWLERAVAIHDQSKLDESIAHHDDVGTDLLVTAIEADPDPDAWVVPAESDPDPDAWVAPAETEPDLDRDEATADGVAIGHDGDVASESAFDDGERALAEPVLSDEVDMAPVVSDEVDMAEVDMAEVDMAEIETWTIVDDEQLIHHRLATIDEVQDVGSASSFHQGVVGAGVDAVVDEEARPVEREPVVAAPDPLVGFEDPPVGAASTGSTKPVVEPPRPGRGIASALLLAVFLIGLGGAAGYFLADYLPERWTAEAEVILDPGNAQVDRYLDTQTVLLQSSIVLDRALVDLTVDREELEDGLEVFPIEASTALAINYVDEDPELAQSVVTAVLESFMTEVERDTISATRPLYEARIAELGQRRDGLERQLNRLETANAKAEAAELAPPYPAEVRRMSLESERLLAQIGELRETLLADEVAEATQVDAVVVTEPRLLADPTWPKPLAFSALGLLVGSIVAAAALFLIASRRAG